MGVAPDWRGGSERKGPEDRMFARKITYLIDCECDTIFYETKASYNF